MSVEILAKCVWCNGRNKQASDWEQEQLFGGWARLCKRCARVRLNNPYNALLSMRKAEAQPAPAPGNNEGNAIMGTSNNQAFSTMSGIPERDDAELTVLMEAVRRLPADRAVTFIESTVRCALGFERSGDPEFLTRSARSALGTLRVRRNPEDQAALDGLPAVREPSGDAANVDEALARLGY